MKEPHLLPERAELAEARFMVFKDGKYGNVFELVYHIRRLNDIGWDTMSLTQQNVGPDAYFDNLVSYYYDIEKVMVGSVEAALSYKNGSYTLEWIQDGVAYTLLIFGDPDKETVIAVAESLG